MSAKHADVYALWGETHAQVREITARLHAEAAKHNRTVRVSLSLRPILAATEDEAWAKAETEATSRMAEAAWAATSAEETSAEAATSAAEALAEAGKANAECGMMNDE